MFVYIALGSYVLQDGYGLSAQAYGLVFAANALGIMAAGRLSGALAPRIGPLPVLRAGVVTALAGAVGLVVGVLVSGSVWAVLVPLFLVVSSVGLLMPNGTALALDGQKEVAGTASGVLGLCQFAFGAVIPPLVSLGGVTGLSMAVTILAVVAAGAAVSLLLRPPRHAT
jgi:DHA1 family bicyclomycin/chloramphenicol resistance-like MFS transporter